MAWTGRLLAEANRFTHSRVVTLTYAMPEDQYAPLDYSHIQNFLKTHRQYTNKDTRYFVCGEFGEESGHAHWHMILFGEKSWQPINYKKAVGCALKGWTDTHGFASCMRLVPATAAYTCGYTLKKGQNRTPFLRCSLKPSIAFRNIENFAEQLFQSRGQRPIPAPTWWLLNGKKYPLTDGPARHFQKYYEALGGRLVKQSPEEQNMQAMLYLRSDEYLSEKTFKRLKRDEQERIDGPTPQEIADAQFKGASKRI